MRAGSQVWGRWSTPGIISELNILRFAGMPPTEIPPMPTPW